MIPVPADAYVLLVDRGQPDTVKLARAAAAMAGLALRSADRPEGDDASPCAVVIDRDARDWSERVAAVREVRALATVPIVLLCRELGDLMFEEAFTLGVDECCRHDVDAFGRVLRALHPHEPVAPVVLPANAPAPVERSSERVLIADPDRANRLLIGRVFRNSGYEVAFAVDAHDALVQALDPNVRVAVCASVLDDPAPGDEPLCRRALALGSRASFIVATPPKHMPAVYARGSDDPAAGIAVHDAFSVPANLLFLANDLVNRRARDARRSERLLFGTVVRFRPAGRADEDIGYCYNLSEGGLYVRTLTPPARLSELWLELVPPRSDRSVHLEARVVWVRPPGLGRGATVPPGFGAEISAATPRDEERYRKGYRTFVDERTAKRQSLAPRG